MAPPPPPPPPPPPANPPPPAPTAAAAALGTVLTATPRAVGTAPGVRRKAKRQREADARAHAEVGRNVVGAQAELRIDVGIEGRLAVDAASLSAQSIRELEGTIGAPDVAEVDGGGDGAARALRRRERPRELAWKVCVEVVQRLELEIAAAICARRGAEARTIQESAELPAMLASARKPRQLVGHLERRGGVVIGKLGVAAEVEAGEAGLAVGERAAHEHAPLGEAQVGVGPGGGEGIGALDLVQELAHHR